MARKIKDPRKQYNPGAAIMPLTWYGGDGAGDGNRTRTVSLED
jgi:hypothetical protein